jgi:hypothetical protein
VPGAERQLADIRLCLDLLITDRLPFRECPAAYQAIEAGGGRTMKVTVYATLPEIDTMPARCYDRN